jgi:hypothetical protein
MDIDPRWVTTPVGAAVGMVLAKKLIAKKDLTKGKLALGAGIGGGAGYLTGQFIKGDTSYLRDAEDPEAAYAKYMKTHRPTGSASSDEIDLVDRMDSIFNVKKRGGPVNEFKKNVYSRIGSERQQAAVHQMRAAVQRKQGDNEAADMNEAAAADYNTRMRKKMFMGGGAIDAAKTAMSPISTIMKMLLKLKDKS